MADKRRENNRRFMFRTNEELVKEAIEDGLERVVGAHPRFINKEKVLTNYIDKTKLKKQFWELYKVKSNNGTRKLSEIDIGEIENSLADYVGKAKAFNKQGKEFVLRSTLRSESKGNWQDYFKNGEWKNFKDADHRIKFRKHIASKNLLKKKDYISKATESFATLKELMKTGDYAQRMPELATAVNEVYDAGFFDAAADVLFQGKLLNKSKYTSLVNQIHKKTEEGTKYATGKLQEYASRRIAASVLAIVGIGVLFTTNSITGGVIGTTQSNPLAILWGAASLILGAWLWIRKK